MTVCSLYEGDIQVIADAAGDNDRRNVNPTNIGSTINWAFIQDYNHEFTALCMVVNIYNTSWKVRAYCIYARVVDISEIERVSAEISDTKTTSS